MMDCNRVLIVEDEADVRDTLKLILELEGFHVATAENGKHALDLLLEMEKPCLILLDLMMPVMDGWEFLENLRAPPHSSLEIPVVVISAMGNLADIERRYRCRAIQKPVDMEAVITLARQYCQAQPTPA